MGGTLPPESRRDQLTRVGFWCRCQKRKALASFNICYILSSCMESMDNITSILVLMDPCFISPGLNCDCDNMKNCDGNNSLK